MFTLFSIPKAFKGHIGIIQRNAIASWRRLHPEAEIILLGNDPGTQEAAEDLGCKHIPEVECNAMGTPLLSGVFSVAEQASSHEKMVYINADIILLEDFATAVLRMPEGKSLLCGIRWDTNVTSPINFSDQDWARQLRSFAMEHGRAHAITGIDYFVFSKGIFNPIPPFAIGRFYWDQWLLYQARRHGADIIDASNDILAIHQNHDYSHAVKGGKSNDIMSSRESYENRILSGSILFDIGDANKTMRGGQIHSNTRLTIPHIVKNIAFQFEKHSRIDSVNNILLWAARQFWDRNWRTRYSSILQSNQ